MSSDTSPNIITISVDTDNDYMNGVDEQKELTDSAPSSAAIADIIITDTELSTDYIRSPQTITISFDTVQTNVITSGSTLYLLFPGEYG